MKKLSMLLAAVSLGTTLWAMPSQMTFQGTLKQQGVPVNGTKNMQFSFVDATGTSIPGTTPLSMANIQVTNGLFAVQLPLDPAIPWEQYSPFIQVSVEGQILSPNQPLNANLYAVSAIPQGMIVMSSSTCPIGWTRFAALDNAFPMGGATYGVTGGSTTHTHTISPDGGHSHTLLEGTPTTGDIPITVGVSAPGGELAAFPGGTNFRVYPTSDVTTKVDPHDHGGTTGSANNLPPYITLVFCQKQ